MTKFLLNAFLRRSVPRFRGISSTSAEPSAEVCPTSLAEDYFGVHKLFTVKNLFDARVHLGHTPRAMTPEMKPFVYGTRFDTTVIDLDQTAILMRQALNFLAHLSYRGGIVLFVCRQPQFVHAVEKTAIEIGEYAHCRFWSHKLFAAPTKSYGCEVRLPDAVILLHTKDGHKYSDHLAVVDAAKAGIPTIAVVDTDCNPNIITYPIPGNDDTIDSVHLYLDLFKKAILLGKEKRKLHEEGKDISDSESKLE